MSARCSARRGPRPRPATRKDAREALRVAASDDGTLAIGLLDRARHPLGMVIVEDRDARTDQGVASDILLAVDVVLAGSAGSALDAVVLGWRGAPLDADAELDLWLELASRCARAGVVLLDWVVFVGAAEASVPDEWGALPGW